MADYNATNFNVTNAAIGELYEIYAAIKNSNMFDIIDSDTVAGGDPGWTAETGTHAPVAGSYFVIQSKIPWADGKTWQCLFGVGGATQIAGYTYSDAFVVLAADFLGTWTTGATFADSAIVPIRADDGSNIWYSGNNAAGHIVTYSMIDPGNTAVQIDGVAMIMDTNAAGTWLGGFFAGAITGYEPRATQPYPFFVFGGQMTTGNTQFFDITIGTNRLTPNSTNDGYDGAAGGPIPDMLYNHGSTLYSGYPVEWLIEIRSLTAGKSVGVLPLIRQGDRALLIATPSADGKRQLFNGIGWPIA